MNDMKPPPQEVAIKERRSAIELPASTPNIDRITVESWLRSKRSTHTHTMYRINSEAFFCFAFNSDRLINEDRTCTCLAEITLLDLEDYRDHLEQIYPEEATQAQKLATIKSLLTFATKMGTLSFNVGSVLQLPQGKDKLAERILTLKQVYTLIETARRMDNIRNYTMIMLLYGSAIRCEELCNLQWMDVQETDSDNGGQITVIGKRRKTRSIPLHPSVWNLLQQLRPSNAKPDEYVFPSRQTHMKNGKPSRRLDEASAWRVVKKIAVESGIPDASMHWLRHSHATHTMKKKVPLSIIMETMGHTDFRAAKRYQHVQPDESSSLYLDL